MTHIALHWTARAKKHTLRRIFASIIVLLLVATTAGRAVADIYQWEWVDPDNHAAGKRISTMLAPGGKGAPASGSGALLSNRDLTQAYLIGTSLPKASVNSTIFANADLSGAKLTQAEGRDVDFSGATLVGIDLTKSHFERVTFANADLTNAIASKALWYTADFRGARMAGANIDAFLLNANLSGVDLTNATIHGAHSSTFTGATLSAARLTGDFRNVKFDGAILRNANLQGADLASINFVNADLSHANLSGVQTLELNWTGANLTGATISGVSFGSPAGLTAQQIYSTVSYQSHDLRGVHIGMMDLRGWDFSNQDITGGGVSGDVTGANFAGASIAGAQFVSTTGLTASQIYSTSTYQAQSLHGVFLNKSDLRGWDFHGMDLSDAHVPGANLVGANFAGSDISRADFEWSNFRCQQLYSTASYARHDLRGMRLSLLNLQGWDFSGQDLTSAFLLASNTTGANFTGARIRGADFTYIMGYGGGISPEQLYSTASYQARDLRGIGLGANDLTGWDLSNQNLAGAELGACTFTGTNFVGADLRGASIRSGAELSRAIDSDGKVLILAPGDSQTFFVRDFDSVTPGPHKPTKIQVVQRMDIAAAGTLAVEFADPTWASTLTFAPNIPVDLDGTLLLGFADGVDADALIGTSWRLFDWSGVSPTGEFDVLSDSAAWQWDTSGLYTSGIVTLVAVNERSAVPEAGCLLPVVMLQAVGLRCRAGRAHLRTARRDLSQ